MLGDGINGTMEIRDGVTVFTAILIRFGGELAIVRVFMAIETGRKFHLVLGVFAGGNVTFGALHFCVHSLERIFRGGVLLDAE